MINFNWNHYKSSGTPDIGGNYIAMLAEKLLADYKPQLLREPGKVNYSHFIESYLDAKLEYHDIYYDEGTQPIVGATAFNNQYLKVFDYDNMKVSAKKVDARTVILDNSIMKDDSEGFARFTALHEAGHLWMHELVYTDSNMYSSKNYKPTVVCCRRSNIDKKSYRGHYRTWTDEELREYQANIFAAAIAMPKKTFVPYATELIKQAGNKYGLLSDCEFETDDIYLPYVLNGLTSAYGVSKTAAIVNLKKNNLYLAGSEYDRLTWKRHN